MLINPMPAIERQVGTHKSTHTEKLKVPFVDLNCGWYCAGALLDYWFQTLQSDFTNAPDQLPALPQTASKGYGWNPTDNYKDIGGKLDQGLKPKTSGDWVKLLNCVGPIIVAGPLGAADWGPFGGVGHFVLIVGADSNPKNETLSYLDPLQGNEVKTKSFVHTQERIKDDIWYAFKKTAIQNLKTILSW